MNGDSTWTPEQQAIVDRIYSGQTDFTFGPGSPNPTQEDLGTYVGGPYSPAGGFAVHGGVALAPSEYYLFTPDQRRALGIMDIAPHDQAGKIERYYAANGGPIQPGAGAAANQQQGPYDTLGGQYASFTGGTAPTGPSTTDQFASAIGSSMQKVAQNMMQTSQNANSQALSAFLRRPQPGASALAQLANNPLMYLTNPYL